MKCNTASFSRYFFTAHPEPTPFFRLSRFVIFSSQSLNQKNYNNIKFSFKSCFSLIRTQMTSEAPYRACCLHAVSLSTPASHISAAVTCRENSTTHENKTSVKLAGYTCVSVFQLPPSVQSVCRSLSRTHNLVTHS